jgi:hypothetical protein
MAAYYWYWLADLLRFPSGRVFFWSVAMAFLWLEFSQSFQVLAILASTLAHAVAFGFRPARAARLQPRHGHVLPFLSRLLVLMGNKEAVYIDDEQIQHQQVQYVYSQPASPFIHIIPAHGRS